MLQGKVGFGFAHLHAAGEGLLRGVCTLWLWLRFQREPGQGIAVAASPAFAPITPAMVQFVPELASTMPRSGVDDAACYFWGSRSQV